MARPRVPSSAGFDSSRRNAPIRVIPAVHIGLQCPSDSDRLKIGVVAGARSKLSDLARADVSVPPEAFMQEHDAYLDLSTRFNELGFDIVHNNSLHYLPVLSDRRQPTVHTLPTPPTPWLESAHRIRGTCDHRSVVVSVSHQNAVHWQGLVDRVIHNGADLDTWVTGVGEGAYALWSGRLVPEKGAHFAIAAARSAGSASSLLGRSSTTRISNAVSSR